MQIFLKSKSAFQKCTWLKQLCQYPNSPKTSKIDVFPRCRSWNTSVFLRPSALENKQFYLVLGSKNFRCSVFATVRGKNTVNADAFASILTKQWRKNTHPKRVRMLTQLLKKSDNAPHSRRRRCGEAAFLVDVKSVHIFNGFYGFC